VSWGCDAPASEAVFTITCPSCDGADNSCARCDGSGKAKIYRCPRMATSEPARRMLRAYRDYERGFLPAEGAMQDQAAGFARCIGIIDAERGSIDGDRAAMQRARSRRGSMPDTGGE
jgi:hypothetical protein